MQSTLKHDNSSNTISIDEILTSMISSCSYLIAGMSILPSLGFRLLQNAEYFHGRLFLNPSAKAL